FAVWQSLGGVSAATGVDDPITSLYSRPAPNFDLNEVSGLTAARIATPSQLNALENLRSSTGGSQMTVRWNNFGGSPDVIYDFASPPLPG
ncbi:hypothetical protein OFB80_30390, partial [Escherichia coli]|nr:hypothetical protein [Escherichia coli]